MNYRCVCYGKIDRLGTVWDCQASQHVYSVTQSYANSFLRDVVLDTFNNVSRDEDNILDQIYIRQICLEFYYEDFKFGE